MTLLPVGDDFSGTPAQASNALWQFLLGNIANHVSADWACLYTSNRDTAQVEMAACHIVREQPADGREALERFIKARVQELTPNSAPYIYKKNTPPNASILIYPITVSKQVLGAVTLVRVSDQAFEQDQIKGLKHLLELTRKVLENTQMADDLAAARSILVAARAIAKNPSPQDVVNILRDHLLDNTISSCAILLYGPFREDRPLGPFEYIEIKGTWSRALGAGIGVGLKFDLNVLPDLQTRLENDYVVFEEMGEILPRVEPQVQTLIENAGIKTIALITLHAEKRRLGLLALTSDNANAFTPQLFHRYQTVSEFLTISTMARVWQQQHDFIQQVRAAVLDAVSDAVMMVLPDKDQARILTVNQRFTAMFGLSESAARGLSLQEMLSKIQVSRRVQRELEKTWTTIPVRDASTQQGEFSMTNVKGSPSDIQWYSAAVYQDKEVFGRLYTFHDVTPERTAERLRSGLLSRVSHELRTPLTSISGFAQMILENKDGELPDLAREYIEIIQKSAKHLNHVFNDMILISQANAGEIDLAMQDTHLPDLIIETVARLEPLYKAKNQMVLLNMDDDLPPVYIDADRITQVITNLVENAIKYSPPDSRIRISTLLLSALDTLPDRTPSDVVMPCALVSVEDEGMGLSPEDTEQVFLPLYRTEEARSEKIEGAGMGLALSLSIIEMHRGKIWALPRQRKGRGGRFLFTLPVKR